jgi:hypothetical protein
MTKLLTCVVMLGFSANAHALSCDDIMNLVKYGVPTSSILQTMKGNRFSEEDVRCLVSKGAPAEVVAKAASMIEQANSEAAPPPPQAEEKKGMDDYQDFGGQGSSGSADDGLSDDGELGGSQPEEIRKAKKLLQSKKAASASYILYGLLKDKTYPDRVTEIDYYLARSLTELKMYHSAQHHYLKVVAVGPKNQYFSSALARMVSIARLTGDDYDLKKSIVKYKITPDLFPRKAKSHLHYLLGVLYYDSGELAIAKSNFEKVSPNSSTFLKARYIEGVIYSEQEKLKSAVRAFRDVYRERERIEPRDEREAKVIDDLTDLALINIASIYFSLGQTSSYVEAAGYFEKVDRRSDYWPEALFRDAWAQYHIGNYDETLGRLLTLESPFYKENQYIPEAYVLKAITYYSVCDYRRVEKIVNDFDAKFKPMRDEMTQVIDQYSTPEGKKIAYEIWNTYFGEKTDGKTALNKAFFNKILRNQELSGISRHIDIMNNEIVLIDAQKPAWKDEVGEYMKKVIEQDKLRYQKRAGKLLLREMKTQEESLKYLINQAAFINLDLSEAKIKEYKKKANIQAANFDEKFQVNFATSSEFIYWPFNGEFWSDELGYYKIKHGTCK